MKKSILLLMLLTGSVAVQAQFFCNAGFTYQAVGGTTLTAFTSTSTGSGTILHYDWTFVGGTPTTSNLQNPTVNFTPNVLQIACLTIITADSCFSTFCDTLNTGPFCQAGFSWANNPATGYQFYDNSQATGNITAWSWNIQQNGLTVFTSNLQNPVAGSLPDGYYYVCLTISTSLGCTSNFCDTVYLSDSSVNCNLSAYVNITPVSYIGASDGALDLVVSGGVPPYTFQWSNGAVTEDQTGLSSGVYTVFVDDQDSLCPGFSLTSYIYEPYDTTGGNIIDSLFVSIDTCLNFVPDSFWVSNVVLINSTTVEVTWTFMGGGAIQSVTVAYQFSVSGNYLVVLTIDCNAKALTTYMSYIHINAAAGIADGFDTRSSFLMYPNPTRDLVYIRGEAPFRAWVYSVGGQMVRQAVSGGENVCEIGLQGLVPGVYMVRTDNGKNVQISKLIINR